MCLFLVATAVLVVVPHHATAQNPSGAVFAMTNAASNNQINAYTRREDGSLQFSAAFSPGGNGIGGTVDPLHSQGSLALGTNHSLPVCRERGQRNGLLVRRKRRQSLPGQYYPTGGSSPTSVTQARIWFMSSIPGAMAALAVSASSATAIYCRSRTRRAASPTQPLSRPMLF
jgi:hypothetical protein